MSKVFISEAHEKKYRIVLFDGDLKKVLLDYLVNKVEIDPQTKLKEKKVRISSTMTSTGVEYSAEIILIEDLMENPSDALK